MGRVERRTPADLTLSTADADAAELVVSTTHRESIDSASLEMRVLLSNCVYRAQNGGSDVKTMTCTQLGGACDLSHVGDDANDIIKAHDRHLREAVATGRSDHEPALQEMTSRWRRPVSGLKWYRQVQRAFAALPIDVASH